MQDCLLGCMSLDFSCCVSFKFIENILVFLALARTKWIIYYGKRLVNSESSL